MGTKSLIEYYKNFIDPSKSIEERCQAFLDLATHPKYNFYDGNVLRHVKFVSASHGKTEWEFTVTEEMCNFSGTLHGGCAATILDDLTSTPIITITKPGLPEQGTMSRTLSLAFLRALRAGEKVKVVCEVVQAGRTTAHFRGDIITEDGKVAVTCVHDKVPRRNPKL